MDRKVVGKEIQAYRENEGLSQEQLAEKTDLSAIFMSAIERGAKSPSLENFVKICNALDASADVLLSGVLKKGYRVKASRFSKRIENLPPEEQERIFAVVDAMIESHKAMKSGT